MTDCTIQAMNLIVYSSDFQCLAADGAVLVLPKGANVYEAVEKYHFQTHAARHATSWYKYMLEEGCDISNGSLYFVTECIKSVNWCLAVFNDPKAHHHLRFIVNDGSCWWDEQGNVDVKVEARVGPDPEDITDEEPNQCVFLRGYKITLRPDIWNKLKNSVAFSSTRAARHSPSQGKSGSQLHQSSDKLKRAVAFSSPRATGLSSGQEKSGSPTDPFHQSSDKLHHENGGPYI
jgi:hypothetical protein